MGVFSTTVLLFSFGIMCALAQLHDIPNRYDFSLNLEFEQPGAATFKFFYTYDMDNQMLKMAVKVLSLGWVGIGFSRNQFMPDTDVAIGWVDDSGRGYLQDRYAYTRGLPRLDQKQNYTLINATEQDGYTVIEMERPLETCDSEDDFTLTVGDTIYLLYAYNSMDPTSENDIPQHQYRQSMIINLFGKIVEPPVPSNPEYLDILADNVAIPNSDTTYWCITQRLPQNIIDETHYITAFEPILDTDTSDHIHHMLVYKCANLTNSAGANNSDRCSNVHDEASECRNNLLIAGWAVGASKFSFPENVAYPIGGARKDTYLLIEIHYDNPNRESGNIDSSGVRFTLTTTPREFNAGVSGVGAEVNTNLFVPPDADPFTVFGYCPAGCTNRFFPASGITIFANFLHSHTVGSALILRQVRNGVELPPIDQNLYYDFNFQLTNHITPRVVRPGDDLIVECLYNSSGRSVGTFGGESTIEEMCFSFIYYYPEVPITYCLSHPITNQFEGWVQQYAPEALSQFRTIEMLGDARDFLDNFQWTDQANRDLESVNVNGIHEITCGSRTNGEGLENYYVANQRPPRITLPYQQPDVCAARNTGGDEDGGAAQLAYSIVAITCLVMLAMFF